MIHQFIIAGELKRVQVSDSKVPGRNPSAMIMVQYGTPRERTGGPVEFVNIALIRVPAFRFAKIKDQLVVGNEVHVVGHIQGVVKPLVDNGYLTSELVADRVMFASGEIEAEEEHSEG